MSTYAISDVHGAYQEFLAMLELISFSDEDILYICGDTLDRGLESLKIVDYILGKKNIVWIKGNHEKLFEEACETEDYSLWFYNGGDVTFHELAQKPEWYVTQLYRRVKKLPLYKIHDNFVLAHAGVQVAYDTEFLDIDFYMKDQDEDTLLWDRSTINEDIGFKDYKFIFGHTPTMSIFNNATNRIIHKDNKIYIDCGISTCGSLGQLACIRLEDLQEFYVPRLTDGKN